MRVAHVDGRVRLVFRQAQLLRFAQRPLDVALAGAGLVGGGVDVDGGMRQGDVRVGAVGRGVEHVPIGLLDGDGQFLLRTRLHFQYLILLMLGQVAQAVGALQGAQRQAKACAALHFGLAVVVRGHEHQMVPQRPQRLPFGTLAGVDAFHQVRQLGHLGVDGDGVVGEHHQLRAAIAHFVRHVEGAAGEADGVEGVAVEDAADAVVEFGAGIASVHVALFAADDLLRLASARKRIAAPGRSSR